MPAVPTAPTITPAVSSSSQMNQFRDAIAYLQGVPHALVYSAALQSIPNSATTALTFDTEIVDTDVDGAGGHSTSANTSRFTARYPGWYDFVGRYTAAPNGTGLRFIEPAVNGVLQGYQIVCQLGSASMTAALETSGTVYLAIGDYLEVYAFQSSGGALNTGVATGFFSSMKVTWVRS